MADDLRVRLERGQDVDETKQLRLESGVRQRPFHDLREGALLGKERRRRTGGHRGEHVGTDRPNAGFTGAIRHCEGRLRGVEVLHARSSPAAHGLRNGVTSRPGCVVAEVIAAIAAADTR
jgi:hypothetical protein